jgi:hypothetical protein
MPNLSPSPLSSAEHYHIDNSNNLSLHSYRAMEPNLNFGFHAPLHPTNYARAYGVAATLDACLPSPDLYTPSPIPDIIDSQSQALVLWRPQVSNVLQEWEAYFNTTSVYFAKEKTNSSSYETIGESFPPYCPLHYHPAHPWVFLDSTEAQKGSSEGAWVEKEKCKAMKNRGNCVGE